MYGWAKLRFLSPIPFNPKKKGKKVKCGLIVMGDQPRKKLVRAQRRTQKELRAQRYTWNELRAQRCNQNGGEGSKAHSKGGRVRKRTT